MAKYSEYMKAKKENELVRFFGNISHKSNKYFTFDHVIDDDNIILITNNITFVKGNPVLLVDCNKAVCLKSWQILEVHNFYEGIQGYAVKLNRNYFKPYTFKHVFDGFIFEKEYTFDMMKDIAESQTMAIAIGHMN